MKRSLLLLLLIASSFSLLTAQNKDIPGGYKDLGSDLPEIKAVDGKLKTHTNAEFKNDHHFFVVMFNPTCGHCLTMTKLIGANSTIFKNNHILFLASAPMLPYFAGFEEDTKIHEHPEMIVAVDSANFIDLTFTYQTLPQINIYDKSRKLVKIFTGDTPLDSLKAYAN